jgi:hypothetical protein
MIWGAAVPVVHTGPGLSGSVIMSVLGCSLQKGEIPSECMLRSVSETEETAKQQGLQQEQFRVLVWQVQGGTPYRINSKAIAWPEKPGIIERSE